MSFSLLEFEQNRAARTTVIDDQSDYFDSSAHWLTDEQRQEAAAKEKAFMERVDRRRRDIPVEFSIDIAGRCIYGVADTPLFPCLLYTSPSPRDQRGYRMPSSA